MEDVLWEARLVSDIPFTLANMFGHRQKDTRSCMQSKESASVFAFASLRGFFTVVGISVFIVGSVLS